MCFQKKLYLYVLLAFDFCIVRDKENKVMEVLEVDHENKHFRMDHIPSRPRISNCAMVVCDIKISK